MSVEALLINFCKLATLRVGGRQRLGEARSVSTTWAAAGLDLVVSAPTCPTRCRTLAALL